MDNIQSQSSNSMNAWQTHPLACHQVTGILNGQEITSSSVPLFTDPNKAAKYLLRRCSEKNTVLAFNFKMADSTVRNYKAIIKQRSFLGIKQSGWKVKIERNKRRAHKTVKSRFTSTIRRIFHTTNANKITEKFNTRENKFRRMDKIIPSLKKHLLESISEIKMDCLQIEKQLTQDMSTLKLAHQKYSLWAEIIGTEGNTLFDEELGELIDDTHTQRENNARGMHATELAAIESEVAKKTNIIKLLTQLGEQLNHFLENTDVLKNKLLSAHKSNFTLNEIICNLLRINPKMRKLWITRVTSPGFWLTSSGKPAKAQPAQPTTQPVIHYGLCCLERQYGRSVPPR